MTIPSKIQLTVGDETPAEPPSGKIAFHPDSDGVMNFQYSGSAGVLYGTNNPPASGNLDYRTVTESDDLLIADKVLICNPTADMTVTLFLSSTVPDDGQMREFYIKNISVYEITVVTQSPDTFLPGNSKLVLTTFNDTIHIGVLYGMDMWASIASQKVILQLRRDANWNASNFTSPTALPWDTLDLEDNDEILEWDSGTPTQVVAEVPGRIELSYWFDIDASGGGSVAYNVDVYVRRNGSEEIPGTRMRTGNYPGEDQSGGIGDISIANTAGDYYELIFEQSDLNGTLYNATLVASMLS